MKQTILKAISDLCMDFTYYDRKEDEELSEEQLDEAILSGDITIDEIVAKFKKELEDIYNEKS